MTVKQKRHIGQNIRDIRQLMGMKQDTLGRKMGMKQQNVSKMENKETPTDAILERAAKAMGTTVEAIKNFDKDSGLNLYFYTKEQANHYHPITEVIAYFKEEVSKKDTRIEELEAELTSLRNGESSELDDNVKSIKKAR